MNTVPSPNQASSESPDQPEWLLWLIQHRLFPLMMACAGSSLLCMALLALRASLTNTIRLGFIPFNLILAFLPMVFLLLMERTRRRWHFVLCSVLWFLFFPNAPYMLTDLVHFDRRLGPASWIDLLALLAAAWAALLGGMITLRFMQNQVRARFNPAMAHGFVFAMLFLTSVGIYIGRFLRFHSVHAFLKPLTVMKETAAQFLPPAGDEMAWPFTLAVFALLLCIHYSLAAFVHASRRVEQESLPG